MRKSVLAAALSMVPLAAAEWVLHDSLSIVDDQRYFAANGNWLDSRNFFGAPYDLQLADDFHVPAPGYFIDTVTMDYVTFNGAPSVEGALVEFFPKISGKPAETPVASTMVARIDLDIGSFSDTVFFLVGKRITANLASYGIALVPGDYYVSMQPVDKNDWGYTPRGWARHPASVRWAWGTDTFGRDGGSDHGNGYGGGYGVTDWTSMGALGYGAGDMSFRITSGWVPEPASLALLGLGVALLRRR